ncbi:transposase [Streptomyces laculatispora]|nr:transposase [Streptomyces laculatispora]
MWRWVAGLEEVHERFVHRFQRAEPRESALAYMRGLVSSLERKNAWTVAERAGHDRPDRLQRLLNTCDWDADEVRDDVREFVIEHLGDRRPVAHVAAEMGLSRAAAHRWVRRWRAEGDPGLFDRSSRPCTTPHRTAPETEAAVGDLRQDRKLGPARVGPILGLPASTVHRILTRHGLNRLAWLDRPIGEPIRRYERDRPGELVHVDIKKLGNIPDGGGWRTVGRPTGNQNRQATTDLRKSRKPVIGVSYVHSAVDDHSRLAYSEVLAVVVRAPSSR